MQKPAQIYKIISLLIKEIQINMRSFSFKKFNDISWYGRYRKDMLLYIALEKIIGIFSGGLFGNMLPKALKMFILLIP